MTRVLVAGPAAVQTTWDVPICSERFCGRGCAPGYTLCRKHGGPNVCGICGDARCPGHIASGARCAPLNACDRCGAASGTPCNPAQHDAHADADPVAPAIAAWEAHRKACHQCRTSPTSAALCLAGAALWSRAGLQAVPVPYERPTLTPIGQVAELPTSRLMTLAASILETAASPAMAVDAQVAAELRVRARALRACTAELAEAIERFGASGARLDLQDVLREIGEVRP